MWNKKKSLFHIVPHHTYIDVSVCMCMFEMTLTYYFQRSSGTDGRVSPYVAIFKTTVYPVVQVLPR